MKSLSKKEETEMMVFINFMAELREKCKNYDTDYFTECPFCNGKFIFSKTKRFGHLRGDCTACDASFRE